MSEADQQELIQGIRDRRLIAVLQYQQAQAERQRIKEEKLGIKMDRVAKKLARCIEKIDDELAKVELEFTKLRAIRFEAFDVIEEK